MPGKLFKYEISLILVGWPNFNNTDSMPLRH